MDQQGSANHNMSTGEDVQGQAGSLFYEGERQVSCKEGSSLESLVSNEALTLAWREYTAKPAAHEGRPTTMNIYHDHASGQLSMDQGRGDLLFSLQESKRLNVAHSHQHQELVLGSMFQHAGIAAPIESGSTCNVRSSLVVPESSKQDTLFKIGHAAGSTVLNPNSSCINLPIMLDYAGSTSTSSIPTALPLLSNSSRNDPPLLQDLPWFANHALEEEKVAAATQAGVRPNAAFSCVTVNNTTAAIPSGSNSRSAFIADGAASAAASASLVALLGENDAELSILQAHIVAHPLFEQLLGAHLACLRMSTPPECWPDPQSLDARLTLSRQEIDAKYLLLARNAPPPHDKDNLDHFMLSFTLLLQTFREQLREHMKVHSAEAASGCAEIKDAFLRLSGEKGLSEVYAGTSTMSEDEEMMDDEDDAKQYHDAINLPDMSMCSPLNMASEIDKSLMENVRKELKLELKQNYRSKLWDVREEIMRKRRAGKLPGSTTSLLKDWWDVHSKWPYPTEEEKMKLVQETGLELKQINNWFINQRKRNWATNPGVERGDTDI